MRHSCGIRPRLKHAIAPFVATACLLASSVSQANVGEAYGFGSRTASLAGAGVAWGFDTFAAYSNPAGLPLATEKRMGLGIALLLMDPEFTPIQGVVTENTYVSDKENFGDVDTSYRSTFGQALGITYKLFPDSFNFTFGLTTFLPIQQVAYMDTGETFVPEYVLYRARTQRPQIAISFGGDAAPWLHIGAGFHLAFTLTSSGSVFLNTDPNKPSTMRFLSSLKPKAAPIFGVLITPDYERTWTFGAVLRLPVSSDNDMTLKSAARAFGSFAALDFVFNAFSALYYDPLSLELGTTWEHARHARFYAQADYQAWSKFVAPALNISSPSVTSCSGDPHCGITISPGQNPIFTYKNIVVPRVGEEVDWGIATLRWGYAYRPSIIDGLPTGAGNYLDPPKHMISVGAGFKFNHFLGFDTPCVLDTHLAYHALVTQHVTKQPGDERGNPSGDKIGSPGYDAGGKVLGGGLSLTLAF